MRTHNMFLWRNKKTFADTPSYLKPCSITRKPHLGLAKAGLHSGVVLFSSGLNSGVVLFFSCLNSRVVLFSSGLNSGVVLFLSGQ